MVNFDDNKKKYGLLEIEDTEPEHEAETRNATETEDVRMLELAEDEVFQDMLMDTDGERKHRGSFFRGFVAGAAASLCGLVIFFGGWLIGQRNSRTETVQTENPGASVLTDSSTLRKLNEVQALIEQYYLDEVDGELLADYLFKGAAVGLDDPYAAYYSSEELTSVLDSSRGEYFGIGAVLSEDQQTGELCIVQVYEGSPAEKSGLLPGDKILMLEGESAAALGLSELVTRIKSTEGAFSLTIYRPDTEEELTLTLECEEIVVSHVEYEMLEDQIGYIQITEFTESAVTQFGDAVKDLNGQNMQKLIVDLRSNPGGLLNSVCDILDEILPEGLIVYTEDKNGEREEIFADDERSVTCEIAVLVDGYSASASEIFAGAVQDYELGPVIGTQTYGKGVVQKTYPLSDGSAFKMTVEKYYTAKGQDIDGNGITPDIIIEETQTEPEEKQSEEKTDSGEGQSEIRTDDTDSGEGQSETRAEDTDSGEEQSETERTDSVEDPVLARAVEELKKQTDTE